VFVFSVCFKLIIIVDKLYPMLLILSFVLLDVSSVIGFAHLFSLN